MKKGPQKKSDSISNQGERKTYYLRKDTLSVLNDFHNTNPRKKISEIVNEAIESYCESNKERKNTSYKVVSLFSGCGGMDLGFRGDFNYLGQYYKKNNFEIVFANDIFKEACETYSHNFKHSPVLEDITTYLDNGNIVPKCDVVIGGFPCQDFSVAGKRGGLSTDRGQLYLQMKRVIEMTQPEIFIAENVKGLTNLGDALEIIKNDFSNMKTKYTISHYLLMAADYGVPQTRERVIIVGVKSKNETNFYEPIPSFAADTSDGRKPWITAFEAINDLSENNEQQTIPNQDQYSRAKNYGSHLQGNKPIKPDFPSPTIRAQHHGNIEFHYNNTRRLTVRECARIQSFPDDFVFLGSASKAYVQIGNAVPPVLAYHIAQSVYDYLERSKFNR